MNVVVLGLQWGDEGKGKAIDFLADRFNVVVRYQGGHNAGHTIYHQGKKVILHLLPSGVFTRDTISVIGQGVVVNPVQLVDEIEHLNHLQVSTENLVVSTAAPLILPFHQELDIVFENSRYTKIGTTRRGIGPAYEDLIGRRSLFVRDLFERDVFMKKVKSLHDYYNRLVESFDGEKLDMDSYVESYLEAGEKIKPLARNTTILLNQLARSGKSILFEGAQGALLDINHGTYPFVTSSNSTVGGIFTGTGLSHKALDKAIGISKAYATRVGGGPFPSELSGSEADYLRDKGNEFGSTTGRPRRVGWLDLVALRYAVMINGVDELFLTKLDVLDELEEIKLVTHYEFKGERTQEFEPSLEYLENIRTIERSFPGWNQDLGQIKSYEALPEPTRKYLGFIEDTLQIPIRWLSVGMQRNQTIRR